MENIYFDEIHKKIITPKTVLCNIGLVFAAFILSFTNKHFKLLLT